MKVQRHAAIIRIVRRERVHNQEKLRELLHAEGIAVTQATLSRDLHNLGLSKVTDPAGGSFYAVPSAQLAPFPPVEQLVSTLLLSIDGVGPFAVVKTPPGSAEALGGSLDHASWEDVLGTIAGDDTLLIITRSEAARARVAKRLGDMAGIKS
ncbi:MAG: arginine repressor [Gemmatimonadetes bacterium]|nr:arginine repressor [Gemmatimonadota bacterium]